MVYFSNIVKILETTVYLEKLFVIQLPQPRPLHMLIYAARGHRGVQQAAALFC